MKQEHYVLYKIVHTTHRLLHSDLFQDISAHNYKHQQFSTSTDWFKYSPGSPPGKADWTHSDRREVSGNNFFYFFLVLSFAFLRHLTSLPFHFFLAHLQNIVKCYSLV